MGDKDKKKGRDSKKPIRRSFKNQKRLTVMVFKNVGRVVTFKISPGILLFAALFLVFYIIATIFITNEYFDIYRINKIHTGKIANLSIELKIGNKDIEKHKEDIAFLNEYIEAQKNKGSEEVAKPIPEVETVEPAVAVPGLVEAEELKIKRDKATISVKFKLVNTQTDEQPIGGYVFVIVSLTELGNTERWVYPSSPLKDGVPENYRKGRRFFIHRFTIIDGKYKIGKTTDKPLTLKILVYNRDGDIVLTKISEL